MMKLLLVFPSFALGLAILSGCQATTTEPVSEPAIVFGRGGAGERSYHLQPASGARPPSPITVPRATGNLQTAPRAALMAATVGGESGGPAALQLLSLNAGKNAARVLANEWAWDFALREDGDAVAWIAGKERRQL